MDSKMFDGEISGDALEDSRREAEEYYAALENSPVIVTRHDEAIEWLMDYAGVSCLAEVIPHVTSPEQIRGRTVIGNLPLHLAAVAKCVGNIDLPGLRPDQRGQDLTAAEMSAAGANLKWYVVLGYEAVQALRPLLYADWNGGGTSPEDVHAYTAAMSLIAEIVGKEAA